MPMAGKIPQHFIDDILERSDIVEIIDSRVKLKKNGRNYTACCPFHDEKTPSFSVNPDKQFYYCFGCGAGGNAISFLMDFERTSFVESIENLARHLGVEVPREEISSKEQQKQQTKRSLYDLLEQANHYYQAQLLQHPQKDKAINYLKQRGLSGEITKHFGIGYAPPGWDNLLKMAGQTPEQTQQLIEAGMLIEKDDHSGCYDRFRDRLMFPIRDNRGRTIAFGGRVLNDEKPKYLNSPETPVFHKQLELYGLYEARQANRHLERLLMVEGYMDVVALAQFGITYAVATLGTSAGSAHMEKVFRHCSEVIFCFDGDEAGRKAAFRALEAVLPLMESGRQAKFLFLPEGEDPDSLIRKIGKDQFLWQMDKAQTLSEHLFSLHEKQLDISRADDKAKLISNIMPHIQSMPGGALQEIILRSLSEKTGLPIDDIKNLGQSITPASQPKTSSDTATTTHQKQQKREKLNKDSREIKRTPARTAISLLVLNPSLASENDAKVINALENSNEDITLLKELLAFIQGKTEINTAKIIGYWQAHDKSSINRLIAPETDSESPEQEQQEYREAILQLNNNQQREKRTAFIEKLKLNPNIRFEDLTSEERDIYLSIFQNKNTIDS
jgi:DNA primase